MQKFASLLEFKLRYKGYTTNWFLKKFHMWQNNKIKWLGTLKFQNRFHLTIFSRQVLKGFTSTCRLVYLSVKQGL